MPDRAGGNGSATKSLSIGALSRATQIPAETLRTWERRYGVPRAGRKPSGHRLYAPRTVEQLRLVKRLIGRGHRPGEILGLAPRELNALLALSERRAPSSAPPSAEAAGAPPGETLLETMVAATVAFDRGRLMEELGRGWIRLGPLRFLEECAGAFLTEIGSRWKSGRLEIRHEHFATNCLRDFLRDVREPFEREAAGPRVAVSTLPGDRHEGGLLLVSVLLAVRGYRVVDLGADTPIEEIAAAAEAGIDGVVVSLSSVLPRARAARTVARLREALPRRVPLWIGGAGAPPPSPGVERFQTLTAFDAHLDR